MNKATSGDTAKRDLGLSGPFEARLGGLCNACQSGDLVTKRGKIRKGAQVWKVKIGWFEVRLCAACRAALAAILGDTRQDA